MNPESGPSENRGSRFALFWVAAALFSALLAFPLQETLTRFPRGLLSDDAYFYVKIAWNLGLHGFSSFDGIHPTDGYHLAWAGVLAVASGFVGFFTADIWTHLGAQLWVYFMLCWGIAYRFGRDAVGIALLFSLGLVFKAMMETTLLALLLLLLCDRFYLAPASLRTVGERALPRAALLFLLPWVRIDALLIGGVLALSSLFPLPGAAVPARARRRDFLKDAAALALGGGAQLLTHFAIFGEWITVSMRIKALQGVSASERLANSLSGFYGANLLSVLLFLMLWMLCLATVFRLPRGGRTRPLVATAAPGVFVLFHLVTNNTISYWYFVPALYVHAWYFLRFGPAPGSRSAWAGRLVIAVLPLLFAVKWAVDTKIRAPQIENSRLFIEEVKRRVPPQEPIYQIDASGWVGWFSERHVVNGDGLVNDHAYARRLLRDGLAGYLREEGIRYVVENRYPDSGILLDQHGLTVSLDSVEALVVPPQGYPNLTAFGLYETR